MTRSALLCTHGAGSAVVCMLVQLAQSFDGDDYRDQLRRHRHEELFRVIRIDG